ARGLREAARGAPGYPVDGGRLGDRAVRVAPDGAPRRMEDRSRARSSPGDLDDQGVRGGGPEPDRRPRTADLRFARDLRGRADLAVLHGRSGRAGLRRTE